VAHGTKINVTDFGFVWQCGAYFRRLFVLEVWIQITVMSFSPRGTWYKINVTDGGLVWQRGANCSIYPGLVAVSLSFWAEEPHKFWVKIPL
jgi:hypothetical protein